ncbi:calcium/sodium antiporter [Candidatus Bipolaricaulota bacterium]|nr:calcium/sodium antiporter [Candidatus Bipolaricaulota bacterium]
MAEGFSAFDGLMLASGLTLCLVAAGIFVRGASRLAARLGISPLIIGLTVVAFGTSVPELAVSVRSAMSGNSGIALGNLVGSNIFNVWGILGIVALGAPLLIQARLVRVHVPILIGVSALTLGLVADSLLGVFDSLVLLVVFGAFMAYLRWETTRHLGPSAAALPKTAKTRSTHSRGGIWIDITFVSAGLAGLILGAHWAVRESAHLATALGVRGMLVGLTVVAVGTSLPELVTSLVAAIQGERDIAVGNVIGSNIFNITLILGITSLVGGGRTLVEPSMLHFAMPVMVASAALCLPIFLTGRIIARWEGGLFLLAYSAFLAHEILDAAGDPIPLRLYATILRIAVAGVCILLALSLVREILKPRRRG